MKTSKWLPRQVKVYVTNFTFVFFNTTQQKCLWPDTYPLRFHRWLTVQEKFPIHFCTKLRSIWHLNRIELWNQPFEITKYCLRIVSLFLICWGLMTFSTNWRVEMVTNQFLVDWRRLVLWHLKDKQTLGFCGKPLKETNILTNFLNASRNCITQAFQFKNFPISFSHTWCEQLFSFFLKKREDASNMT